MKMQNRDEGTISIPVLLMCMVLGTLFMSGATLTAMVLIEAVIKGFII
jgi:hypothetical protein